MELFKIKLKKDMKQAYFTNNFDIINTISIFLFQFYWGFTGTHTDTHLIFTHSP